MWQNLCECAMLLRPSVNEILQRLRESSVCTGTQCFETEEDAFGIQSAQSNDDYSFAIVITAMLLYLTVNAPHVLQDKPSTNLAHHRDFVS